MQCERLKFAMIISSNNIFLGEHNNLLSQKLFFLFLRHALSIKNLKLFTTMNIGFKVFISTPSVGI